MADRKRLRTLVLDQAAYAGFRRQEYENVRPGIRARNYRSLCWMCLLGLVIVAGLAAAEFFVPRLRPFQTAYLVFLAVLLVLFILAKAVAAKNDRLATPLIYAALSAALIFAIALGSFLQPEVPATAFPVLLFALPLVLTDKPYRCGAVLLAATAVFCAVAAVCKPQDIFKMDLVNALSYCLLSLACNQFIMQTKISELVRRRSIEHERDIDGLTKLLNRTTGQREVLDYIRRGRETGLLIMLDIDGFRAINGQRGHAVGDDVLRLFGESIKETFRQSDILVRFGGDEFLVFMPYVQDRDCVKHRLATLEENIAKRRGDYPEAPPLSFSAGVSIYPHDAIAYDELLKMADDALDFSKKGESAVCFYRDCFGNGKQASLPIRV